MNMKIESAALQCTSFEPAVEETKAPPPPSRLEQAKSIERAVAGDRGAREQYLFERFSAIPPDGALTLELKGKANLALEAGAGVKVTAERTADGDYLVRVQERGHLGAGAGLTVEGNLQAAGTFWVRTPEAAADLVVSLADAQLSPSATERGTSGGKSAWYAQEHLVRAELTTALDLHGSAHKLVGYVGGEVSLQSSVTVDLHKGVLTVDQAVGGEFADRLSSGVSRLGTEYELVVKLRTETELPPSVLDRVRSGELSVVEALRGTKTRTKLVVEGEKHGEVVTLLGGMSQVKKLEAEVDLVALSKNPLEPMRALHGEVKVYNSLDAAGGGQDALGNLHVRSAIYDVTKQDLFHHDDSHQLQSQVDALRSVAPR